MSSTRTKRVVMVAVMGVVGMGLVVLLSRGAPREELDPLRNIAVPQTPDVAPPRDPVRTPQFDTVQGVEGEIVQTDPKTGRIARQFIYDTLTPREGGVIEMKRPRMRVFLEPWRVLEMVADHGRFDAPNRYPESGEFDGNLVITVYQIDREVSEAAEAERRQALDLTAQSPHRVLKIKLDRATFNTALGEVRSDSPVELLTPATKRAYFRGRGLLLVYNELASRIDHLEITRGDTLRYRPPTSQEKAAEAAAEAAKPRKPKPDAPTPGDGAAPAAEPEPAPAPSQFYRVTFERQVRAVSEDRTIDADTLVVYFPLDKPEQGEGAKARPPRKRDREAGEEPTALRDAHPGVCEAEAEAVAETPQPPRPISDDPDAPLAGERDVVLTWAGKMVMVPVEAPPPQITAAKDTYFKFIGAPVTVTIRQSDRMVCQTLEYIESATTVTATGTPAFPLRLSSPQLGEVSAPLLTVNTRTQRGRLDGAGTIRAPDAPAPAAGVAAAEPGDAAARAGRLPPGFKIAWTQHVDLVFAAPPREAEAPDDAPDDASAAPGLESATFVGDVSVEDPQMTMKADELATTFASPAGSKDRQLAAIDAEGQVDVKFRDSSITADRLRVQTAADESGDLAPRRVLASGSVVVVDPTQRLEADSLDVTLIKKPIDDKPPADDAPPKPDDPRMAIDVDKAHAEGNVRLTLRSDTVVRGDALDADAATGSAVLFGDPVKIERGGKPGEGVPPEAELHVNRLDLKDHGRVAFAEGKGVFIYTEPATDSLAPRPAPGEAPPPPAAPAPDHRRRVRVTWTERMSFADAENIIQVFGSVVAEAEDAADEMNRLTAGKMTLELIDPAAIEAALEGKSPADRKPFDSGLDRRQLRKLTARDDVVLLATKWTDATRQRIETRVHIAGPLLIFNNISEQAQVIGPGKMLLEDLRPPSVTPADAKATPMSGRGATAFTWTKRLLLDNAATDMTIEGDSHLTHQPAGAAHIVELQSARLVADLESTTAIRALGMTRTDSLSIRKVHATGTVQVRDHASNRLATSDELIYEGERRTVLLRAEPPAKVSVVQLDNPKPLRADVIFWDLTTDTVEVREVGF